MAEILSTSNERPKLWRWILGTFIILFGWLVLGAILTAVTAGLFGLDLLALAGSDMESLEIVRGYEPWQAASAVLISFLPLLLLPIALHRLLLGATLRTFFTRSTASFAREVALGAAVMALLLVATGIPDFILNNSSYSWSFDVARFIPYLLVAFTLIPIQTTAEEVFYRGWIQQRLENGRRSIWLVSIIGGFLFALPHLGNPEVSGNLLLPVLGYGSTGFMFTWVTMRDQSMGLAIGAHASNNILAGLLVSSADSALPAASIWVTPEIQWGPAAFFSILFIPLFIWLTGKWRGKVVS
jgi:membrane protease YdiL (CAAX protease family)